MRCPMLRSRTMHTIHELAAQGLSLHAIARQLGLARNTVRKYVRGAAVPASRPTKPMKLDPFKEQIRRWVQEDHLLNCVTSPCATACVRSATPGASASSKP